MRGCGFGRRRKGEGVLDACAPQAAVPRAPLPQS
jgi:hypothetical protein